MYADICMVYMYKLKKWNKDNFKDWGNVNAIFYIVLTVKRKGNQFHQYTNGLYV